VNKLRNVYFARCLTPFGTPLGAIKIGCSYGHELRLKNIASNQPYSLELIGVVPGQMITEAMCHIYLKRHRIAGEFFYENPVVMSFVDSAVERGRAFFFIDEAGTSDYLPSPALEAFMNYHGITVDDVCAFLERDPAAYRGKLNELKNRRFIAAALIVAQRADGPGGRFVSWPNDCVLGLIGQQHRNVKQLPAPSMKEAA